jgi:uncharacterized protein YjbI with pentapeptide repeats
MRRRDPDPPDLPDELPAWRPRPLERGFEVADALVSADLSGAAATAGAFARCRIAGPLAGARLRSLSLVDVALEEVDASNADLAGGRLKRVALERCRLTGLGAAELAVEDLLVRGCKLDLSVWRFARLRNCRFEDCVLDEADLAGATLQDVRFDGCSLRRADFDQARLTRVDFRGSRLEDPRGGVTALRGAIIDPGQLIDLAPALAAGLGITVDA